MESPTSDDLAKSGSMMSNGKESSGLQRLLRFTLISILFTLSFQNCAGQGGFLGMEEGFSLSPAAPSSWNKYGIGEGSPRELEAKAVLQAKCANCHTPPLNNGALKEIMNIHALITGGWIIPGDPINSKIFIEVQTNRMPRNNPPLTVTEREILRSWIYGDPGIGNPIATPTPPTGIPTPTPTPIGPPTYANIAATILTPKCVSCHNANNRSGNYAFDTHASTLAAVVAGNPNNSPLYQSTTAARMPKGQTPLSGAELTLISAWIAAGALNN